MTRTPFDQLAKQFFEEFLSPRGQVEKSREVPGEPRLVDIWFAPSPQPMVNPTDLGLLGRLASTPCLLEPFRNAPSLKESKNCLLKLLLVHADLQRQGRRESRPTSEAELPRLWILGPTASAPLLTDLGVTQRQDWPTGVYFLAGDAWKTGIIAINQLPAIEETLWLRLLGKGSTQQQAIEAVCQLPPSDPRRATALQVLANWRITIEQSTNPDEEDQELIMTLSQAYLEWERETKQQGIQQGIQQEKQRFIEGLLKTRFGELDEQLIEIIPALVNLSTDEAAQVLLQRSRSELIERFQSSNS